MPRPPINAATVKSLRQETGVNLMSCKRALQEANGDYEVAKRLLMRPPDDPDEPIPEPVE